MLTHRTGQLGINVVENIVLSEWGCRWQQIDAQNDDGVDGLIFIERGGEATGQIVFAQVKCTESPISSQYTKVAINSKKLAKNLQRWRRLVGAAILIHVHPRTQTATWVNLRDDGVVTKSQVLVPTCNILDRVAKKHVSELCGTIHRDVLLPQVDTTAEDFKHLTSRDHIQSASRQLYRKLAAEGIRLGGTGPRVKFTRSGWKHITRRRRSHLSEIQSLILLGSVKKIIEVTPEHALPLENSPSALGRTLHAARAAVSFSFRQTGVVKVVLQRHIGEDEEVEYSFVTVYEPKRKRNVLGARGPLVLQAM